MTANQTRVTILDLIDQAGITSEQFTKTTCSAIVAQKTEIDRSESEISLDVPLQDNHGAPLLYHAFLNRGDSILSIYLDMFPASSLLRGPVNLVDERSERTDQGERTTGRLRTTSGDLISYVRHPSSPVSLAKTADSLQRIQPKSRWFCSEAGHLYTFDSCRPVIDLDATTAADDVDLTDLITGPVITRQKVTMDPDDDTKRFHFLSPSSETQIAIEGSIADAGRKVDSPCAFLGACSVISIYLSARDTTWLVRGDVSVASECVRPGGLTQGELCTTKGSKVLYHRLPGSAVSKDMTLDPAGRIQSGSRWIPKWNGGYVLFKDHEPVIRREMVWDRGRNLRDPGFDT